MVEFNLKYISNGIFNVSRRHQGGYMPERACELSRKDHTSYYVYYDGVRLDTKWIPSKDGYSELIITVSLPEAPATPDVTEACLAFELEHPVLLTFRCGKGYTESYSIEGGISEEFRGVERGSFYWRDGEYVR